MIIPMDGLKVRGQRDILHKYESKTNWSKYINIRPVDFRAKTTIKNKEGHYVMVNGINSSRK